MEKQVMWNKLVIIGKKKNQHFSIVSIQIVELVAEMIAELVKPTKVPLRYPCIIYFSFEHCTFDCLRKIKI